jgi:nucleoside phosphorylase
MMDTTLITAAVEQEVRPLVGALSLRREAEAWTGDRIVLALTGMGSRHGGEATARLIERHRPGRVLSIGVAGALRPTLAVAEVIVPAEVIDAATGQVYSPTAAPADASGRLVTAAALCATVEMKRTLAERYGGDAVDMETAAIARVCGERGVAWASVRAISDAADRALPAALGEMVTAAGEPDLRAIAMWSLRDPRRAGALMRLGRDTNRAARALADAIVRRFTIG